MFCWPVLSKIPKVFESWRRWVCPFFYWINFLLPYAVMHRVSILRFFSFSVNFENTQLLASLNLNYFHFGKMDMYGSRVQKIPDPRPKHCIPSVWCSKTIALSPFRGGGGDFPSFEKPIPPFSYIFSLFPPSMLLQWCRFRLD